MDKSVSDPPSLAGAFRETRRCLRRHRRFASSRSSIGVRAPAGIPDMVDERQARGRRRVAQRRRRLRPEMALEPRIDFDRQRRRAATSSISPGRATPKPAARRRRLRHAWPRRRRRATAAARRRRAETHPARSPAARTQPRPPAKMKSQASASSKPPPRQRPRTRAAVGRRKLEQIHDQPMHLRQHAADAIGRVFGNACAEAEVSPSPSIVTSLRCGFSASGSSAARSAVDHLQREDVALGMPKAECRRASAPDRTEPRRARSQRPHRWPAPSAPPSWPAAGT